MNRGSRSPAIDPDLASAVAEPPEHLRAHLERVLASRTFANAPVLQRFLRFVVLETIDGRGDQLKEFVIAVSVFGRGAQYDPHEDAAVRVAARRLRQKLQEYYEDEGRGDEVRILLHPGSYRPDLEAPPVHRDSPPATAPARDGARRRLHLPTLVAAGIVASAVGLAWWALGAAWSRPPVVAVLPFENATTDAKNGFVCFGLVEELTTRLARTDGLRVVARTSAAQFGTGDDVREVARRLGATAVVEGSVRGEGGLLRITAQLVRASDGSHLWAQAYDREASDLLGMQEDVARDVAAAVSRELLGGGVAVTDASRGHTAPAAVAAYWQGRYQRSLRTEAHRRRSLELFEEAIAADPGFAPAQAAAGEVLATMAFHAEVPTEDGVSRARALSRRALSLDDTLGQAHATLGWIAFFFDRDWAAAEREFRRALALNPSDASARQLYAQGLASRRRAQEAVAESEAAARLDPLSYATSADLGVVLYLAGRFDECIARARQVLEAHPDARTLHGVLGVCHIARGNFGAGREHIERFIDAFGRASFTVARLGQALAGLGETDRARELLAELDALARRGDAQFSHLAILATSLGETDRALVALAEAVDRHEADVTFMAADPAFNPLRRDPRFASLLRRLRLPE